MEFIPSGTEYTKLDGETIEAKHSVFGVGVELMERLVVWVGSPGSQGHPQPLLVQAFVKIHCQIN